MIDRNGTELKVGDLVLYHVNGTNNVNSGLFKIEMISNDAEEIDRACYQYINCNPPYAKLYSTERNKSLSALFFSNELRKAEVEDLI